MKPLHSIYITDSDDEYRLDIYKSNDFSKLDSIVQGYGVLLNKVQDQVLIVKKAKGHWSLAGGTAELGETPTETLIREVLEETSCELEEASITPYFYQTAYIKDADGEWKFLNNQVRFIATVSKSIPFVADPDGGVVGHKWINFDEFHQHLEWQETSSMIEADLLRMFEKR